MSADSDTQESALRLLSVRERFADESFNYQKMKDHTLAGLKVCFDPGSLETREGSSGGRVRTALDREVYVTATLVVRTDGYTTGGQRGADAGVHGG